MKPFAASVIFMLALTACAAQQVSQLQALTVAGSSGTNTTLACPSSSVHAEMALRPTPWLLRSRVTFSSAPTRSSIGNENAATLCTW